MHPRGGRLLLFVCVFCARAGGGGGEATDDETRTGREVMSRCLMSRHWHLGPPLPRAWLCIYMESRIRLFPGPSRSRHPPNMHSDRLPSQGRFVCLYVCLSVCLSVCVSVCRPAGRSVGQGCGSGNRIHSAVLVRTSRTPCCARFIRCRAPCPAERVQVC
jgi:hypothetical protein